MKHEKQGYSLGFSNKLPDYKLLAPERGKRKRKGCLLVTLTSLVLIAIVIVLAAALFYTLVFFGVLQGSKQSFCGVIDAPDTCTTLPVNERFDCWPEYVDLHEKDCLDRGCCYNPSSSSVSTNGTLQGVPYCYFPSDYTGYMVDNVTNNHNGFTAMMSRQKSSGWSDVLTLRMDVTYETQDRLHFKIYDPSASRYEVPVPMAPGDSTIGNRKYEVEVPTQGDFYVRVTRKDTGDILFDSKGAAPLIFGDQFLQLGTRLSTAMVYGLGEHRGSFKQNTNWTKLAFWARDQPPEKDANLYGVHPFYLNIEKDNSVHGVFLLNSNAMEVALQPMPALTYRTTGGVLDFYVFAGPTSDNVVQQYTALVGRPFMPPYWALGFHLCRWGYGGDEGLEKVIKRMRDAKMPYDTQWNDIDYMSKFEDWSYDKSAYKRLPDIVQDLHDHGQHYIMIVDPGISNQQSPGTYPPYDDGLRDNVFIMTSNGSTPYVGTVWPGKTVFPDFFHPNTSKYWQDLAEGFHQQVPFDGLWTDMNEPSSGLVNACLGNRLDFPPFTPPGITAHGFLFSGTVCPSAKQYISSHYNLHSLYGYSEMNATMNALHNIRPGKRSLVISRSTFSGSGVHGGHWTGDNHAMWEDTYFSITDILNFQLFGVSMVGADVCGFSGDTNPELCTRWMQLGAFYPFMRNHNSIGKKDQDPAVFDTATQDIMRNALLTRYTLLPYLYTLFYQNHMDGTPVMRPLFFQYPNEKDGVPYSVDWQFMWGSELLITPVTSPGVTKGQGYLPADVWYDLFNHSQTVSKGEWIWFDLPMEHINVQVRGGSIIPLQAPNVTTTLSRKQDFSLLVALAGDTSAQGQLYWDDGEELDAVKNNHYTLISFYSSKATLNSTIINFGYKPENGMVLEKIYILGAEVAATAVSINGNILSPEFYGYDGKTKAMLRSSMQKSGYQPPGGMMCSDIYILGVSSSPSSVTLNGQKIQAYKYSDQTKTLTISKPLNLLSEFNIAWYV